LPRAHSWVSGDAGSNDLSSGGGGARGYVVIDTLIPPRIDPPARSGQGYVIPDDAAARSGLQRLAQSDTQTKGPANQPDGSLLFYRIS
jgi:hypothetical protein